MAYLRALGCYLPERIVDNAEIGPMAGADPAWILQASGIEQRRFAGPQDTVASMGVRAAQDCLATGGANAREVGLILAASGSGERRFPGPASAIGGALGIPGVPAIDLPMASAGSLFAMSLAAHLAPVYGNVLVVASEIMSRVIHLDPISRDTAILFGDGAGACLIGTDAGVARIADSVLHTDGEFAEILTLHLRHAAAHGRPQRDPAGRAKDAARDHRTAGAERTPGVGDRGISGASGEPEPAHASGAVAGRAGAALLSEPGPVRQYVVGVDVDCSDGVVAGAEWRMAGSGSLCSVRRGAELGRAAGGMT